ncbi:MAG: chemotaxis protein CheW [Planctomycetota bacterium]
MLAVVFHLGEDRYALPARRVAEIVPYIPLRGAPGAPAWVAGVFDYRGVVVPVVDLDRYVGLGPCPRRYSSRILVCMARAETTRGHGDHEAGSLVGALAERVLDVQVVDPDAQGALAALGTSERPALGRLVKDETGLIQLVDVEDLIPRDLLARLTRDEEGDS